MASSSRRTCQLAPTRWRLACIRRAGAELHSLAEATISRWGPSELSVKSRQREPKEETPVADPEGPVVHHLRVAVPADAKRDRHLSKAEPRAIRFHRPLQLNAKSWLEKRDGAIDCEAGG